MSLIFNPQFLYSAGATIAVFVLLVLLLTQRRRHQRCMKIAAQSIADADRRDQESLQMAGDVLQRYSDHFEACHRASGTSARTDRNNQESISLREENQSSRQALQPAYEATHELPFASETNPESEEATLHPASAQEWWIDRIHELEREILKERKRNQRLSAKAANDQQS